MDVKGLIPAVVNEIEVIPEACNRTGSGRNHSGSEK